MRKPTSIRESPTWITQSATGIGLSAKYYIQDNPTTNPFGAVGSLLGFAQQLSAGSQVASLTNTVMLSPNLTWEQHVGFHAPAGVCRHQPGVRPEPAWE